MEENDFIALFQRYLENKCTRAEFQLVMQALEAGSPEEKLWSDLMFQYLSKEEHISDEEFILTPELKGLLNDVFSRILTEINKEEQSKLKVVWNPWRRFAAAAAILFLLFTSYGIYRFESRYIPAPDQESAINQNIVPGGNKAVLTLSDGRQVALSDSSNGTIANEGNVVVTKASSGRVTYQVKGAEQNAKEVFNTISTPKGGQFQIDLPDGTKVWLNAASSLRYPTTFSKSERKVELNGEAYFEVKSNKSWPFRLTSGNQELEVLGTMFNVSNYPDEGHVTTTLVKGSVRVHVSGDVRKQIILKPNQQSQLADQNFNVKEVYAEDEIAWKEGLFKFDHNDLETTMKKICRWYDVGVVYEQEDLKKLSFMGSLSRYETISDVLKIIAETGSVRFEIKDRIIYVKPRLRSRIR